MRDQTVAITSLNFKWLAQLKGKYHKKNCALYALSEAGGECIVFL